MVTPEEGKEGPPDGMLFYLDGGRVTPECRRNVTNQDNQEGVFAQWRQVGPPGLFEGSAHWRKRKKTSWRMEVKRWGESAK